MEPLEVELTEFYPRDNARESRTEEYELVNNPDMPTPVLRRGCNFVLAVRFTRDYDEDHDVVRIGFGFGEKPHVLQGTRAILPVFPNKHTLNNKDLDRWEMCLNQKYGNTLMLTVRIPANVPVGIWHCSVQTNIKGDRTRRQDHQVMEDIYILFNPWCRQDGVFMESEEELKEYIMNETGKIWCGTFKNPKGKKWIFGQFDDVVLPASVFLLEKAGIPATDRASPIAVSRAISAIINSVDDSGLLEGRWDGQYEDGTSPHAWTGSTAILDIYLATGGQPIKYGQCWVFSAATVTVCRALGIPCRSTTNFISAHDTNFSLTVDKYFDLFGNKIEDGPDGANDSCWNFHVWNDVWMTRPDLPAGYGGWQVIDATPQEASGGIFRCGPASVEAVRRGEVGYMFDTPFVFAEVNADVCHFQEDEESDWGFSRTSINQYHVGRRIITKAIDMNDDDGDSDLWDVTSSFKNMEGTEAERLAVYNAVKGVPNAQQYYEMPSKEDEDVIFDLVEIESVPFGENFDLVVNIRNNSDETRNISAILSAFSVYYTGATAKPIKRVQGVFAVKGGETEVLRVHVNRDEYLDKLVDHSLIKIYSIANVKETRQTWSEEDDFTLSKPTLNIDHDSPFIVGMESCVRFSFRNPLEDMPLTECTVTVEGPGLSKPKTISKSDVGPSEIVEFSELFTPKRLGQRCIVANFNSKEIQGINGCTTVAIE